MNAVEKSGLCLGKLGGVLPRLKNEKKYVTPRMVSLSGNQGFAALIAWLGDDSRGSDLPFDSREFSREHSIRVVKLPRVHGGCLGVRRL